MVGLASIFVGGLYLDGWAHTHGRVDQSLFTPWHAVLYGGYALVTFFLLFHAWRGRKRGQPVQTALPAGYNTSLLGAIIFGLGGVGDMLWHTFLGIELGNESGVSPPHVVLVVGLFLVVGGPLRAHLLQPEDSAPSWKRQVPAIISMSLTLAVLTFMTFFWHHLSNPNLLSGARPQPPLRNASELLGTVSLLLTGVMQIGILLHVLRTRKLPFGAIALVFGVNAFAMGFLYSAAADSLRYSARIGLVMALVGLASDLLIVWFKPSRQNLSGLRLFAFFSPLVTYLLYFAYVHATQKLWWSIGLWGGVMLISAVFGLLLSYAMTPGEERPTPA